ncbi:MAG: glycosyltransferase family 4 protein, partial [Gemmatimonadetes bacterium]|nr:glycosyltransferase family 4 protein [Gemmatimonadota bacterium]
GHRSVARLLRDAIAVDAGIEATHLDLSAELTAGERVMRRLLTLGPRPGTAAGGMTAARFRHEMDAGLRAARRIAALERRGTRFDVIHFHTQAAAWGSLRRMRRTPSIVSIDITQRLASLEAPPAARRDYAPGAARDRRVFREAAAIVATSRWAADGVVSEIPDASAKVHVMPYPVPLDGFDAGWIAERRARPTDEPVRVLFVGGDFARKGGPELLAAWRDGGFAAKARLTLVTEAPLDPAALPAGVEMRRGVRAYTPEWFALWRQADLFAMPTRGEAFGMVYQEAAAAGLPAIGTALNAIPEIVADGETGILVPSGDAAALVDALRRLVESPELRMEMGSEARRRIEATGSIAGYGRRLAEIVRGAAAGGARG